MTAIERVAQAARTAGLEVTESTSARWIILTAPDRHRITVKYDRAGRLTTGSRHVPGDITRTMTASGLEARVMSWLDEHRVDTVIPAAVDIMADLDRQYEAADAFEQGGRSGLDQLDERRRMPRTPHAFEGITAGTPDRPCTRPGCGLADRHPIHGGITAGGGLTQLAETGASTLAEYQAAQRERTPAAVTVDGPFGGDTYEIGLDGTHLGILTRTEGEALRDRLTELFGPAPTDH